MSVNLSRKSIRQLIHQLTEYELNANEQKRSTAPFIEKVGVIKFKHHLKSGVIDFYIGIPEEPGMYMSYASLCKFTDGKVGIVLKSDPLLFSNNDLSPCLFGAIAHELGHYINGDLDNKTEDQKFLLKAIDFNIAKQIHYSKLENDNSYNNYIRSTVFGVLKGGILNCELDADIVAVQLVGLPAILMARIYDAEEATNPVCLIEHRNRNNRLIRMVKECGLELSSDSKLNLIFDKRK